MLIASWEVSCTDAACGRGIRVIGDLGVHSAPDQSLSSMLYEAFVIAWYSGRGFAKLHFPIIYAWYEGNK